MAKHADKRVVHRPDNAPGHVRFIQIKNGMDRSDDKIELGQDLIRELERPVSKNVALGPGKEPKSIEALVEFANVRQLNAQPRFIQSMALDCASAMVGDTEI